MNLQHILHEIEQADPEIYERISPRRKVIQNWSRKVALTALPFALGSLFQKAYGKTTGTVLDALNFALKLEYLESEFYKAALSEAPGMFPDEASRAAITVIRDHEIAHVAFLRNAITVASGAAPAVLHRNNFDFTANGIFPDVLGNYDTFLAVAQTFEDTGVRAYKGQAGFLAGDNATLTAALQIHSVEARHASHIRLMRRIRAGAADGVRPWITLNQSGISNGAVTANYAGEDLTVQSMVNIININGQSITAEAASQAFDEPLTDSVVLGLVGPFFLP